jgi:serine O-acetyltransferase
VHLERFKQDVARWIVPEQVSPLDMVTLSTTIKLLYRYMALRAMLWFRFGSWCNERGIPFMSGFIQRLIFRTFGLEIMVGSNIEGGFYLAHPIGTVIGNASIGQNCTIIGSATLGMRNDGRFPTVGDGVFIGIGARILGGIHIGDGAMVGANAVVLNDVPAGVTVVGIPARPVGEPEPAQVSQPKRA